MYRQLGRFKKNTDKKIFHFISKKKNTDGVKNPINKMLSCKFTLFKVLLKLAGAGKVFSLLFFLD